MPHLYYITNRQAFPGSESSRQQQLLKKIKEAAAAGVDYIQLREKDLSARALENLARAAIQIIKAQLETGSPQVKTKLLINSRTDVALAAGADGVHLRSDDISPEEVRAIQSAAARNSKLETRNLIVGISCHSVADVRRAAHEGADFAVLAPIFGKQIREKDALQIQALGLETIQTACEDSLPIFALGGITLENASACLNAGAKGIAAVRLFQEHNIQETTLQVHRSWKTR